MIAQGKAAEAAALGKEPPHQSLFLFRFGAPQARQTGRKKEGIILRPQPRAALRLPWAIIMSSLPGLQLGWPAHIFGERQSSATGTRRCAWQAKRIVKLRRASAEAKIWC